MTFAHIAAKISKEPILPDAARMTNVRDTQITDTMVTPIYF